MNLSCYLLIFILGSDCTDEQNIQNEKVFIYVQDLNYATEKSNTCTEDSLYKIIYSCSGKKQSEFLVRTTPHETYFDSKNKNLYGFFPPLMSKEIVQTIYDKENPTFYVAIELIFDNSSNKEKRRLVLYVTGGTTDKNLRMYDICNYHIENTIRSFLNEKLLKVEDFKTDCLESLCEFMDFFNCFNLVKDTDKSSKKTTFSKDYLENTITVSDLKSKMNEKLDLKFKNIPKENKAYLSFYKDENPGYLMYTHLYEHLEKKLLSKSFFLPIFSKAENSDYYIDEFFNRIFHITEVYMAKHRIYGKNQMPSEESMSKEFDKLMKQLEKDSIDRIFILKLSVIFNLFFCEKISDDLEHDNIFLEADKMVCDYYNMIECMMNKIEGSEVTYLESLLADVNGYKIIQAYEIDISILGKVSMVKKCNKYENPSILKDDDYILHANKLYLTLDKREEKKIETLRIYSAVNNVVTTLNFFQPINYKKTEKKEEIDFEIPDECVIS